MKEATATASPFQFIHLSDPHLTTLEGVRPGQLCNKRILGYLSWRRRRRHLHQGKVLDAMLEDIQRYSNTPILVTGDLTHIGLPTEFQQASRWLTKLGDAERVQVIPGNHELYVNSPWHTGLARWAPYLSGDAPSAITGMDCFPSVRVHGDVAMIGVNSAVATPPFMATGLVGELQMARLADILESCGNRGLCRVVAIHHPPVPGTEKWRKRLADAPALAQTLETHGAELLLHGHSHKPLRETLQTSRAAIPAIGLPSASSISRDPDRTGAYHLCTLQRDAESWQLSLEIRRYDHESKRFESAGKEQFSLS